MRIAVTGGTGFIGRYVLPLLVAEGHDVWVLSRNFNQDLLPLKLQHCPVDLLSEESIYSAMQHAKPEVLLHLAWYAEHGKFWTSDLNFKWAASSAELLKAFQSIGGRRILMAGTCAEYDWTYGYCDEALTPLRPKSVYGKCKDAVRQHAELFCAQNNIELAWARIFFPYGPGESESRLVPSVLRALINGDTALCSHGRQFRDFLHVTDAASAIACLLLQSGEAGCGIFNIGSGEPIRIASVIEACAQKFKTSKVALGAIPVGVGEPMLLVANVEKMKALGWQPRVGLSDGIQQYLKTMLNK